MLSGEIMKTFFDGISRIYGMKRFQQNGVNGYGRSFEKTPGFLYPENPVHPVKLFSETAVIR